MSNKSPQDVGVSTGLDPNLFGDGDFVQVRAALIREVGAVEAIILSRIHFRADESYRHAYEKGGEWWWRAPALDIANETGLTEKQVKRALTGLRDRGLIVGEQHKREGNYDRAMSYRVNLSPMGPTGTMDRPQRADVHGPQGADVPSIEDPQDIQSEPAAPTPMDLLLDELWNVWPAPRRKTRKVAAASLRTAVKAVGGISRADVILKEARASAEVWAKWPKSTWNFIPLLPTWLNQEGWTSARPQPRGDSPGAAPQKRVAANDEWMYR